MLIGNDTYVEHLNESNFDWLTWRSGSIFELLSIPHNMKCLVMNKAIIQRYAIGYCRADTIPCRPKNDHIAVMFNTEGNVWWAHLTRQEFTAIFPEVSI